jgi:hypothetical protein
LIDWDDFAQFAKDEDDRRSRIEKATVTGLGAAYVGQQTIRSGVPRLLGVRLESHSTSNKNAAEILKNGGILDPARSGSNAIRSINIGGNSAVTANLAKSAIDTIQSDGSVKGYKRRTKSGRITMVRGLKRQLPAGAS